MKKNIEMNQRTKWKLRSVDSNILWFSIHFIFTYSLPNVRKQLSLSILSFLFVRFNIVFRSLSFVPSMHRKTAAQNFNLIPVQIDWISCVGYVVVDNLTFRSLLKKIVAFYVFDGLCLLWIELQCIYWMDDVEIN